MMRNAALALWLASLGGGVLADVNPPNKPRAQWDFEEKDRGGWIAEGPHRAAFQDGGRSGSGCLHLTVEGGISCDQNVDAHPEKWTRVYRKVTLPYHAKFLRVWMHVTGRNWHEPGRIFVDAGSGPKLTHLPNGGNGGAESYDWACHEVDIGEFRGQTVLLGFVAANWNGYGDHVTDILIDDAAITDEGRKVVGARVWRPEAKNGRALTPAEIERNKRLAAPR